MQAGGHLVRRAVLLAAACLASLAPDAVARTQPAADAGMQVGDAIELPPGWWVSVAGLGDVDGDGAGDVAIVLPGLRSGDPQRVRVVFGARPGAPQPAAVDARPGYDVVVDAGIRWALSDVGDVNGDGLADLGILTSADFAATVVYGKADGRPVSAADPGPNGFRILDVGGSVGGGGNGVMDIDGITAIGDQNGDGRPDLAITSRNAIKVVHTPAAAGATIDTRAPGPWGSTIATPPHHDNVVAAPVDDLDGDGVDDLAVGWTDSGPGTVHIAGMPVPAAGTTAAALAEAAAHGFHLTTDDGRIEWLRAFGDLDGDGRRDLGAIIPRDGLWLMRGIHPPPAGTEADLDEAPGFWLGSEGSHAFDAGDQDGDGLTDIASNPFLRLSRNGFDGEPSSMNDDGAYFPWSPAHSWTQAAAATGDANGDGRPELLIADVEDTGLVPARLVRWDSAPDWQDPGPAEPPPGPPDGIPWPPPVAPPGPADEFPGGPAQPGGPLARAASLRVAGTRRDDRLTGGPGPDVITGRAGDDVLRGLGGADRLTGGRGRDRVLGGAGRDRIVARDGARDTIRCGPGRDVVLADRRDRVGRDCERVTRR